MVVWYFLGATLLLELTGQVLEVTMWREDVGEKAGFCTSNGAQVTCDTFRYLLRPASTTQAQQAECVSIPPTAEALQHRQLSQIYLDFDHSTLRYKTFEALRKRF